MILFDQVSKIYKLKKGDHAPRKALDKVSFYIKPREFVVLVGASGVGKSTVLKLLTCQEFPTSGRVVVGGIDIDEIARKDIPNLRRKIGFIFQDFKLLPKKTVIQNIAFALEMTGTPTSTIKNILPKVIKMVGLEDKEYSLPGELSGGEMQRVAIARSLMHQPKILLADEPTGNLDPQNAWKVINLLVKINQLGTTVVLATHNQDIVRHLAQRTIVLENGRIQSDKPAVKKTPKAKTNIKT